QPRGDERLTRLALDYGHLLQVQALSEDWSGFIQTLSRLAVDIKEGVFSQRGTETASYLVLAVLGDQTFRLRVKKQPDELVACLQDALRTGDSGEIVRLLREWYNDPIEKTRAEPQGRLLSQGEKSPGEELTGAYASDLEKAIPSAAAGPALPERRATTPLP